MFLSEIEKLESLMPQTPTKAIFHSLFGGLAHLGERLPCKQEVTGSSPVSSTYCHTHSARFKVFNNLLCRRGGTLRVYYGLITQLGECYPCKVEVEGSNPFSSTSKTP